MAYCDEPITDSWNPANLMRGYFCGVGSVVGAVSEPAVEIVTGAQSTIGGIAEDVTDAANPANLAGAAAGAAAGAIATAVGIGLAAALAADWLVAGGSGTRALGAWVVGKGRK